MRRKVGKKDVVFYAEQPLAFSFECEKNVTFSGKFQFLADSSIQDCGLVFRRNWPITYNSILLWKCITEESRFARYAAELDMQRLAIREEKIKTPKIEFGVKWR